MPQLRTRVGRDVVTLLPYVGQPGQWLADVSVHGEVRPSADGTMIRYDRTVALADRAYDSLHLALEAAAVSALLHQTGHLPCRWCDGDGCRTCHGTGVTPR